MAECASVEAARYRGLLLPVVVPLPDVVPDEVPVVPVDVPDAPEPERPDDVPVDGDDVFEAGARIDAHGSSDFAADCEAPRAPLAVLLALFPAVDDAVALDEPG